jgi:hypothetical protein
MITPPPPKPDNVARAELTLWLWTAWACLYGIYETRGQIPEIEDMLTGQLEGMISISPNALLLLTIAGYAGLGVLSAWIIYEIGRGKHWARSSLLWGFGLEILTIIIPPYKAPFEYLTDVPDLGLQIYALHLLYAPEARSWFLGGKKTTPSR